MFKWYPFAQEEEEQLSSFIDLAKKDLRDQKS